MNSVQVLCGSQDGDNPLDATSVHPESYEAAEEAVEEDRDYIPVDDIKGRIN